MLSVGVKHVCPYRRIGLAVVDVAYPGEIAGSEQTRVDDVFVPPELEGQVQQDVGMFGVNLAGDISDSFVDHVERLGSAAMKMANADGDLFWYNRRWYEYTGAKDSPPLVCYAGEIRQVLANLVGNAVDATPRGGTLRLRVRKCTDWRDFSSGVRVTVADTGHGMSARTMKRLYEPFFTTKEDVGTGLGLWVSAGIVEKHGGSLRALSSVHLGKTGTVSTVYLSDARVMQDDRARE